MKLYLVRHSQTDYNLSGILDSSTSTKVHLNQTGIEQSERLAERLKDVDFDAMYISEMFRTKQTAKIIGRFHRAPIIADRLLNEYHTGFDGHDVKEWLAAIDASPDKWSERFGDGESLDDVIARAKKFIEKVKQSHDQCILVVTHGFVVQALSALLQGRPDHESFEHDVEQGDYSEFELF